MNNRGTLSNFGDFGLLLKEAINKDIENIDSFLGKKIKSVKTPYPWIKHFGFMQHQRPHENEWTLDDHEINNLKILLEELKHIYENVVSDKEINKIQYKRFIFGYHPKHTGKNVDNQLYKELIRIFCNQTVEILLKNNFKVENIKEYSGYKLEADSI